MSDSEPIDTATPEESSQIHENDFFYPIKLDNFHLLYRDFPIPVADIENPTYQEHRDSFVGFAALGLIPHSPCDIAISVPAINVMNNDELIVLVRALAAQSSHLCGRVAVYEQYKEKLGCLAEEGGDLTHDEFIARHDWAWRTISHIRGENFYNALREEIDLIFLGRNCDAGFIYVLKDPYGHYKIGRTINLSQRIKQLATQPPFELELFIAFKVVNAVRYEAMLHQRFAKYRVRGEWFKVPAEWIFTVFRGVKTLYDINGDVQAVLNREIGREGRQDHGTH